MQVELKKYITASATGRRRKPDGHRFTPGTVNTYRDFARLLDDFGGIGKLPLQISTATKQTAHLFKQQKGYWERFYRCFTDYLYQRGYFDNYVATQLKILRTFLRYVQKERGWLITAFLPHYQVRKETLPVIVFSPEQLHFLIHNPSFEQSLTPAQRQLKDIVVAGCTVALRISDLMALTRQHLVQSGERWYLSVLSGKTKARTLVLLPPYVVSIFQHYSQRSRYLLPRLSKVNVNKGMKALAELAGWTEPTGKVRMQRGVARQLTYAGEKEGTYRFCDLVTSHTMRRTAITTMLILGTPEGVVRQISGHAPGSKEFFRYVAYSRAYLDQSIQQYHSKMQQKEWVEA